MLAHAILSLLSEEDKGSNKIQTIPPLTTPVLNIEEGLYLILS